LGESLRSKVSHRAELSEFARVALLAENFVVLLVTRYGVGKLGGVAYLLFIRYNIGYSFFEKKFFALIWLLHYAHRKVYCEF
jgi:hypothetical protein